MDFCRGVGALTLINSMPGSVYMYCSLYTVQRCQLLETLNTTHKLPRTCFAIKLFCVTRFRPSVNRLHGSSNPCFWTACLQHMRPSPTCLIQMVSSMFGGILMLSTKSTVWNNLICALLRPSCWVSVYRPTWWCPNVWSEYNHQDLVVSCAHLLKYSTCAANILSTKTQRPPLTHFAILPYPCFNYGIFVNIHVAVLFQPGHLFLSSAFL